jgi:hypothetical protein
MQEILMDLMKISLRKDCELGTLSVSGSPSLSVCFAPFGVIEIFSAV